MRIFDDKRYTTPDRLMPIDGYPEKNKHCVDGITYAWDASRWEDKFSEFEVPTRVKTFRVSFYEGVAPIGEALFTAIKFPRAMELDSYVYMADTESEPLYRMAEACRWFFENELGESFIPDKTILIEFTRLTMVDGYADRSRWAPSINHFIADQFVQKVRLEKVLLCLLAFPLEYEGRVADVLGGEDYLGRRKAAMERLYHRTLGVQVLDSEPSDQLWMFKILKGLECHAELVECLSDNEDDIEDMTLPSC